MFSQLYDKYVTGLPSGLEDTVTQGMQQFITDQGNMGTQLGNYANQAMNFQSGQNQAQRQMLQDQASRATAMGGMQAQRMAAQQGMGRDLVRGILAVLVKYLIELENNKVT
jgi:hypothetical protein